MTVHVRWPGQTGGAFGLALIFLVLFASRQKEHKRFFEACKKVSILYRTVFKLPYFLCLETKKVTKKIQGQTNGSARLSGPPHMKSHYNLKILLVM